MDKYEYNLKLEEIKKLAESKSYEEAARIADTVDWKRVRNARTLCMVSEIYEAVDRMDDSKTVLIRAYRRSQAGRMILYRLAELSIKTEDFDEAIEYYSEFVETAPNDNSRYILKYKIYKGRGSSIQDQIAVLEDYKEREYTEKWAYELARLYYKAGDDERCIEECDDLVLWFRQGDYVIRALELKKRIAPLTREQQVIYDHRDEHVPSKAELVEAAVPELEKVITESMPSSEQEAITDSIISATEQALAQAVSQHAEEAQAQAVSRDDSWRYQSGPEQTASGSGAEASAEEAKPAGATFNMAELQKELASSMHEIVAGMTRKESDEGIIEPMNDKPVHEKAADGEVPEAGGELPKDNIDDVLTAMAAGAAGQEAAAAESTEPGKPEQAVNEGAASAQTQTAKEAAGTIQPQTAEDSTGTAQQQAASEDAASAQAQMAKETAGAIQPQMAENSIGTAQQQAASEGAASTLAQTVKQAAGTAQRQTASEGAASVQAQTAKEVAGTAQQQTANEGAASAQPQASGEPAGTPQSQTAAQPTASAQPQAAEEPKGDTIDLSAALERALAPADDAIDLSAALERAVAPEGDAVDLSAALERAAGVENMRPQAAEPAQTEAAEILPETPVQSAPQDAPKLTPNETYIFSYFASIQGLREQIATAMADAKRKVSMDRTSRSGNIVITGAPGSGRTTLGIRMAKALGSYKGENAARVAKIYAEDFNKKDIPSTVAKIAGGVLIIEEAGDLADGAARQLSKAMEFRTDALIVILEDEKHLLRALFDKYPELAEKFTSEVTIPIFTNDELVAFGKTYAYDEDFRIADEATMTLYNRIGEMQTPEHPVTVLDVKDIVDKAIRHSERFGFRKLGMILSRKRYDEDDRIILYEKDFR